MGTRKHGGGGGDDARLEALERKVEVLEATSLALSGVVIMGAVTAALRRNRTATFHTIAAQRIVLAQPSGTLRVPGRIMAELAVRPGGRSELTLHGGTVTVNNVDRSVAAQLSASFRPLPPGRGPTASERQGDAAPARPLGSGQAWATDRHGLEPQLRALTGAPALVLYGADERPLGALAPGGGGNGTGWMHFGALEPPRSDPGGGSLPAADDEAAADAAEAAAVAASQRTPPPPPPPSSQTDAARFVAPPGPGVTGKPPRAFDFSEPGGRRPGAASGSDEEGR